MKRTLTTLGVSTALLCTLAFAATGQSPITQIKQVLSSASRTQDKSLTINKESLSLLKLQMPGKMKKAQANGKQSYVDLLAMEGLLRYTSNSINYESNTNSWIMSFNEKILLTGVYWTTTATRYGLVKMTMCIALPERYRLKMMQQYMLAFLRLKMVNFKYHYIKN